MDDILGFLVDHARKVAAFTVVAAVLAIIGLAVTFFYRVSADGGFSITNQTHRNLYGPIPWVFGSAVLAVLASLAARKIPASDTFLTRTAERCVGSALLAGAVGVLLFAFAPFYI